MARDFHLGENLRILFENRDVGVREVALGANFIAINKNFTLNSDFARTVADSYQAGVESMDFTSPSCRAALRP